MPDEKVAVVGDCKDPIFDYEIELPYGDSGGLSNDWQIEKATPFHETIKLEADMILNGSIAHWWTTFEKRDVVVVNGTKDFYNQTTTQQLYRRHLSLNYLPDVYNAVTYWRHSQMAITFFRTVKMLFENWSEVKELIKGWSTDTPDTDTVYAIAISILGTDQFLIPNPPQFAHMKGKINYCEGENWTKELVWELNEQGLRINTIQQTIPTHYYIKDFSKTLEEHYDNLLASGTRSYSIKN